MTGVTVYVGQEDFEWQLPEVEPVDDSELKSVEVDLESTPFIEFDQDTHTFSLDWSKSTNRQSKIYNIEITWNWSNGQKTKQIQTIVVQLHNPDKPVLPLFQKLTEVDSAGKFSLVFSRPVEIEIGYLNAQLYAKQS